jgi:transcription termination factor NusB
MEKNIFYKERINIIKWFYFYFLLFDFEKDDDFQLIENSFSKSLFFISLKEKEIIFFILKKKIILIDKIEKNLGEKWSFRNLSVLEKSILIFSTYEIIFTNLNKKIIINESVNITKRYVGDGKYKYVNAVLDKLKKDV